MARGFHRTPVPPGPAADYLAQRVEDMVRRLGRARLAVAGGSAQEVLGLLRRALPPRTWGGILLTWVDERCVPFADPRSNRGDAYRQGHLDVQDPPALELPLYLDAEDPARACARTSAALREQFQDRLDVLLLGLGEDGHIASLFPGRPFQDPGGALVLPVLDSPKPPPRRITLALPLLATAPVAVLVAAGAAKRTALERLARGDPALPASALGDLDVFTDQDVGGDAEKNV
ncbi:MAG: 6-phosphogluconolactonase [Holophaga sp.]|jgi:6-phosphogluconolactonase